MKNVLLLFLFMLPFVGKAQIGESSSDKKIKLLGGEVTLLNGIDINGTARISISEENIDDNGSPYYMLSYQNQEYTSIRDTQIAGFFASKEDLDYLFGEMKKVFKTQETVNIPLGKSNMRISYSAPFKQLFIQMRGQAKGNFSLNVQQFYYLFGRGAEWNRKSWKKYLKS